MYMREISEYIHRLAAGKTPFIALSSSTLRPTPTPHLSSRRALGVELTKHQYRIRHHMSESHIPATSADLSPWLLPLLPRSIDLPS